jgi:hypothetical protein
MIGRKYRKDLEEGRKEGRTEGRKEERKEERNKGIKEERKKY